MPTINESAARSIEDLMEIILPKIWDATYTVQDILNLILCFLGCRNTLLNGYKQISKKSEIQDDYLDELFE